MSDEMTQDSVEQGQGKMAETKGIKRWPMVVLAVVAVLGVSFGIVMMILWLQERDKAPEVVRVIETEVTAEETKEETEKQEVDVKTGNLKLSGDKFLTREEGAAYGFRWEGDGLVGLGISVIMSERFKGRSCGETVIVDEDTTDIDLSLDWGTLNEVYALGLSENEQKQRQTMVKAEGIDARKVTDVMVGGFGQAVGEETIFFIMDDGSVEYIPVYQAAKTNSFKSRGAIEGVEGIVKLRQVGMSSNCIGFGTVLAQKANGEFYDLYSILKGVLDEQYRTE